MMIKQRIGVGLMAAIVPFLCFVSPDAFGVDSETNSTSSGFSGGLDASVAVGAYLNGAFPEEFTEAWITTNAFPHLSFTDPLWIMEYPGTSNDVIVIEKTGRIYCFENSPHTQQSERTLMLDWNAQTKVVHDQGFYRLAFHPDFGKPGSTNRFVYACYSYKRVPDHSQKTSYWRVSRFTIPEGSRVIDATSESVLIHQYDPDEWHNGGGLFFGADGFLYVVHGDGGIGNDVLEFSQKTDQGLFGGILRIDVDQNPQTSMPIRRQPRDADGPWQAVKPAGWTNSYTQGYFIPTNNPLVYLSNPTNGQEAAHLEEFIAIGLRSPHSMHYDEMTGEIWMGDVGQISREEINLMVVPPGAPVGSNSLVNFQWPYREGSQNGPRNQPDPLVGIDRPPEYDYARLAGAAVIGGYVYRDAEYADELGGKLLFGDHVNGVISAMDYRSGSMPVVTNLAGFYTGWMHGMANFCRGPNGEIWIPNLNGFNQPGGTIEQLVKVVVGNEPPPMLSQTGAFSDLTQLVPAAGLLPFDVNAPLWSDGANKRRWIALPNDGIHDDPSEQIEFSETENWVFPAGTVVVKHFELPMDEMDPLIARRLETRFIVCTTNGGKYGVTYRWNEAQTDAELISGSETGSYDVALADGEIRSQTWDYPGRTSCLLCHNESSGQIIGARTHQLNGPYYYSATGRTANQLATWNELGMFDQTLTSEQISNFLWSAALDDEGVPVEHRVRSYLDSNCAHCHQPGAPGPSFDARLTVPLVFQDLIGGELLRYQELGPDARQVLPGSNTLSAIHYRMAHAAPNPISMPPLAKNRVDEKAVNLVENWINRLDPAAFSTSTNWPVRLQTQAPSGSVGGGYEVVLTFDHDVEELDVDDFLVTNAVLSSLQGSRYLYILKVLPTGGVTTLQLPENIFLGGNQASEIIQTSYGSIYDFWAVSNHLVGADSDRLANPDGDSLPNLAEFMFNFDPGMSHEAVFDSASSNGPSGLPDLFVQVGSNDVATLMAAFPRRVGIEGEGYSYWVEACDDLQAGNWQLQTNWTATPVDAEWDWIQVSDEFSSTHATHRFMRVRIDYSEPN